MTPTQFWRAAQAQTRLQIAIAETMWNATFVIPARMMQIGQAARPGATAAVVTKVARESVEMVTEKVEAAMVGATAAALKVAQGADANVVALAAVAPAQRRARSNAKRLSKPTS